MATETRVFRLTLVRQDQVQPFAFGPASLPQVTNVDNGRRARPLSVSPRVRSGRLLSFSAESTTKGANRPWAKRYVISIEPIGSSGVVLTIAELPRLVIFGETAEDALGWAREAIAFQLRDLPDGDQTPPLELDRHDPHQSTSLPVWL